MTEIIVYRNPVEAAFWHLLMDSPYTFPAMVALVVFVFVFALMGKVYMYFSPRVLYQYETPIAVVVAGLVATIFFMVML